MGLIAGMMFSSERNILSERPQLDAMMAAQRHRDNGSPAHALSARFLLGMSNKHNMTFCANTGETAQMDFDDIVVAVDGIVLEADKRHDELVMAGYRPVSLQATAIIAAAYRVWGMDFMQRLDGEFACVVYDRKKHLLLLVRDPYGHKPMHYFCDENRVVFASEIKGVLAGGVPRAVDMVSMSDFLTLNGIPYPSTIFKNIRQVEPGTILAISARCEKKSIQYWNPIREVKSTMSLVEAQKGLECSLKDAVRKRMVGQDTYCFLSGGIDSSAVLSYAAEQSPKPVKAITVSFDESEVNELEDARAMAKHVGATHYSVVAKPDHFFEMLQTLVHHHDSPFADTSAYPSYYAGKLGRQYTDLILTGDGPDQTLAGSAHHVFAVENGLFNARGAAARLLSGIGSGLIGAFWASPAPSTVSKIRRSLYRGSLDPVERIYELRAYVPELMKRYLCTGDLLDTHQSFDPYRHPQEWFGYAKGMDNVNRYLYADIRFYITDDLMIKVDRMCMAHALETLSPFQDKAVADIVLRMPGAMKLSVSDDGTITTKYILKEICRKRFPASTLQKKKQGFGIPIEKWLRHDGGKYLREVLLDPHTLGRGYFHPGRMEKLVNDFLAGRNDYFYANAYGMISLITLELWHREYIDQSR